MFTKSASNDSNVKINNFLFLSTLTFMSMAGLIGSDVYLPNLPAIGAYFHTDIHFLQITLGVYLFGLSIGQILLGPLSDAYGRKKVLFIGMSLYMIASLSCALSETMNQLIISRIFQAIGACSGLVVGRAIIGDIYDLEQSGKVFATILPFVGMSTAVSPVIGGFIGYYFNWKATFFFIALFASFVLFLSFLFINETLAKVDRKRFNLNELISTYPKIISNKKFIAYACAPCFAYMAYFAYISQSPFILTDFGFSQIQIGFFYISLSTTYFIGGYSAKRLLNSFNLDKVLSFGYSLSNLGAFSLYFSHFSSNPIIAMIISVSILTLGSGFLIPLGTAGVISSCNTFRGYASGLLGFIQLGLAAISAMVVNYITSNSIAYLGLYISSITIISYVINRYFTKTND